MNIDGMIAQLLEDSKASHSFQTGGANGYPTTQVFFFSMLSGDKLYLMRTVAPEPLEPERGETPDPPDLREYNGLEHQDEINQEDTVYLQMQRERDLPLNVREARRVSAQDNRLVRYGYVLDVTQTLRELYRNRFDEYFYFEPDTGRWIQTVLA